MSKQNPTRLGLAALLLLLLASSAARAQEAPAAPKEPAAPPATPSADAPSASGAAPPAEEPKERPDATDEEPGPNPDAEPLITAGEKAESLAPEPDPKLLTVRRSKPLRLSTGLLPNSQDSGSEMDIVAGAARASQDAALEKWAFQMKGYMRIPVRASFGPRNDGAEGNELHTPPRIAGGGSSEWGYASISQNPSISLYALAGNPLVTANIIVNAGTASTASYQNPRDIGGITQAYLTLKFPSAFGSRGGIGLNVGAFSNRYGMAGPRGRSSGYYGTYLFGRTHTAGETLVANLDLSSRLEFTFEQGFGAKLEVVPRGLNYPDSDENQGGGTVPSGSNFVHHEHVALNYDDWLGFGAHYLKSWSPNDESLVRDRKQEGSSLQVFGAEVHIDSELQNGYFGYSHADGENLVWLQDGIQVIHGSHGRSLSEIYFAPKPRNPASGKDPPLRYYNDTGTIDTLLAQYTLRLAYLLGDPFGGRDFNVALYGMFAHAKSPQLAKDRALVAAGDGYLASTTDVDINKLKFGAEAEFALIKYMSLGLRFDRVLNDMSTNVNSYTAITPKLRFYSRWKSKEYFIVSYSRYFLGPETYPGSPYTDPFMNKSDQNLFQIVAAMSL